MLLMMIATLKVLLLMVVMMTVVVMLMMKTDFEIVGIVATTSLQIQGSGYFCMLHAN